MNGETFVKAFVSKNKAEKAPIEFLNKYAKNNNLIIEKEIKGELADLTKKFDFEVTIGNEQSTQNTFEAKIIGKDNRTLETVTFNAGVMKKISLGHKEQLKFENVPIGTRYTVKEVAAKDGYTPKVTVLENGVKVENNTSAVNEEAELKVEDKLVGENENKVSFVNEYGEITLTGILENNLPFILMISVAAIGFAALAFAKKFKMAK